MDAAGQNATAQRPLGLGLLVVLGILSLPLAAAVLDGESTDHLVVPVQLAAMALIGAVVGYLLPGLGGDTATRSRGALVGLGVGVALALVGILLFSVLLG